ncbi:VOC family protein [Fundidesulfovibrio putealis]|uniref:VOC family protein n=1 Tax=Fundidesulfovibrio putealis TaxID=270496 RepID=UPI00041E6D3A|nr:VOC family protein [Fundidesulfovibrio putealis]
MPIQSLAPNLMVEDVNRSADFWCGLLGFGFAGSVDTEHDFHKERHTPEEGKPALIWAQFIVGKAEVMVQRRDSLTEELPLFKDKPTGATATVYLGVDNLDELHARLKDAVPTVRPLQTAFYGMREWYIQDPDGYVVCLAQPA